MGCAGSKETDTSDQDARSKQLEAELAEQQKKEDEITKLLVLGTGESGKSTVFKQMKILYQKPDPMANTKFIMVCRANLFGNAHAVAKGMDVLGIKFSTDEGRDAAKKITELPAGGDAEITAELPAAFAAMYSDAGVNEAIERASEFQLNDSTRYFFQRADEVLKLDYVPSQQDVLRARVRTTGIVQQNFEIENRKYTMFDVGGQRNERRKWIHCFDNVTACIFVTAISEYDQVLYEDSKTNRMDEAVTLFTQICNHDSFKKTSMILFLNKRDLFEEKLKKKPLTCWDKMAPSGDDYHAGIAYITQKFIALNKDPLSRQVYCHATCGIDTDNVNKVMSSVFDIILKENLRKMQKADLSKILDSGSTLGKSAVKTSNVWAPAPNGKVLLCAACYTDSLAERKVLVSEGRFAELPAVEVMPGSLTDDEFMWLMELGREIPRLTAPKSEIGSFKGNFKEACAKLREILGLGAEGNLGFLYDKPIILETAKHTLLVCVRKLPESTLNGPWGHGFKGSWVVHEDFENANYKAFMGVTETVGPPDKNVAFQPFDPNPVGFRWFKGLTLFEAQVSKMPKAGVHLGIFRVVSTPQGFKIMVNEHNRVMIPTIFLSSTSLQDKEKLWMHGVRIREAFGISILEGGKPNLGWLGPDMDSEDGVAFKEKLDWAVREAKFRLGIEDEGKLGDYYDTELLQVDEKSDFQILIYASLAKDESDILPGHIWVERQFLEVQNMKYYCPTVLQALLCEQQSMVNEYLMLNDTGSLSAEEVTQLRKQRAEIKERLNVNVSMTTPLKWVNRVIMWCADKMPSFGDEFLSEADLAASQGDAGAANKIINKALGGNIAIAASQNSAARQKLLEAHYTG